MTNDDERDYAEEAYNLATMHDPAELEDYEIILPAGLAIGATRACPDCGRPQHYTGIEAGWSHDAGWYHDALIDTWHCADPAKADRQLISHLTPGCTCDHRPGDPCNASCPVHLGAGLRRA